MTLLTQNQELARLWYEVMWSEPDLSVADQIVSPGYAPSWISIPKQGPEQVKHEIRYFRSVFPDLRYRIVEVLAERDKVWIRYEGSGTQSGAAWGFPASNKTVTFEGATILYIKNAQIIDRWGAFSFYDILQELGLVPSLWSLQEQLQKE